jgi:hypothetical protein
VIDHTRPNQPSNLGTRYPTLSISTPRPSCTYNRTRRLLGNHRNRSLHLHQYPATTVFSIVATSVYPRLPLVLDLVTASAITSKTDNTPPATTSPSVKTFPGSIPRKRIYLDIT